MELGPKGPYSPGAESWFARWPGVEFYQRPALCSLRFALVTLLASVSIAAWAVLLWEFGDRLPWPIIEGAAMAAVWIATPWWLALRDHRKLRRLLASRKAQAAPPDLLLDEAVRAAARGTVVNLAFACVSSAFAGWSAFFLVRWALKGR